eukprot:TRINITY_DN15102_c0_g1_i1.p1 TRINITY_DN15102_c0_g1~~TRINITY_DN15102_c0_g1_i1.p1  ORF type:complete len:359 (-),score=35.95 TRINITY_DN15102_c0_g1_i1:5-1081(-)
MSSSLLAKCTYKRYIEQDFEPLGDMRSNKRKPVAYEDSLEWKYPHIALMWNSKLNENCGYSPSTISARSLMSVYWTCGDHTWQQSLFTMTAKKSLCVHCEFQKTCLTTLHPTIAEKSFIGIVKEDGKIDLLIKAEDLSSWSDLLARWRCPLEGCDTIWETNVKSRVRYNQLLCEKCFYINKKNRFDLKRPDLVPSWHPVLNGELKPSDVAIGTEKRVWWQCVDDPNHSAWRTSVKHRAITGSGCPDCSHIGTSTTEIRFREFFEGFFKLKLGPKRLHDIDPKLIEEANTEFDRGFHYLTIDVQVEVAGKHLLVDLDLYFAHGTQAGIDRDSAKSQVLIKSGYLVVRVRPEKHCEEQGC